MIWLIGGTSESVIIAQLIVECRLGFVVSVTTANARHLYDRFDSSEFSSIFVGKLTDLTIPVFLQKYHITKVIDCSHPFARNISQSVIDICRSLCISYLRFERKTVSPTTNSLVTQVSSLETLVTDNSPLANKRVLLTIGAKNLFIFKDYHDRSSLYARILPYPESLDLAYQAGFGCSQIIAIRPPFTPEFEQALWQLWQIEVVVTKAGGKAGGEDIKYQVAQQLNIPLIVIDRPDIIYPQLTNCLNQVQEFISSSPLQRGLGGLYL